MKVTINSVEIKALSHFVNPKETREFLQGVTVIVDGQQVSLFASTGTVIGFFRCPCHPDNAGNADKCRVLIPYAIAKGLKNPCITLEVLEDIAKSFRISLTSGVSGRVLKRYLENWHSITSN